MVRLTFQISPATAVPVRASVFALVALEGTAPPAAIARAVPGLPFFVSA